MPRFNLPLKLPRSFYEQSTIDVAKQLLGKFLVHRHDDRVLWSGGSLRQKPILARTIWPVMLSKGRTKRTEVMFGAAGHAYVYFIYGFYNMLNLVTEAKDYPARC